MDLRLPVSTAFSFAVHGLLIFGLLQTLPNLFQPELYTTLDVILANTSAEKSPEQAYLKSDQAQLGVLSSDPEQVSANPAYDGTSVLSSQSNAQFIVSPGFRNDNLWAKYDHSSVKRRTVSAASHQAKDAAYLAQWREKIEHIGTTVYQQSVSSGLTGGDVLMLVAVDRAGELVEIQIRRSSGSETLDALAVAIVQQSAPFEPLPATMQQDTDILEIIRTWKFHSNS